MVYQVIEPDLTIAGGVIIDGQPFTVDHNQLTGNPEGKRVKLRNLLQDTIDKRTLVTVWNGDPGDLDDEIHSNAPGFGTLGYNTYSDLYTRPDDSLIDEQRFYWQQNPNRLHFIFRVEWVDIINSGPDPALGGETRYTIIQVRA